MPVGGCREDDRHPERGGHRIAAGLCPGKRHQCEDRTAAHKRLTRVTPKTIEQITKHSLDFVEGACRDAGVPCETMTTPTDTPAEAILDAASGCGADLILMASHGRIRIQIPIDRKRDAEGLDALQDPGACLSLGRRGLILGALGERRMNPPSFFAGRAAVQDNGSGDR